MGLSGKEKFSYGLGAVGKDMVYMLSASYILYYYQDILDVNAVAMGIILLVARVFDAFNDPFMGVIVAKTRTRWGKFRPWLMIGTVTNAVVLYLMFSAPPALNGSGLVAYAAVCAFICGVTEPFEFGFMFLAPALYVIYALLYGIFTMITVALGFRAGFSFSAGAMDLLFSSSLPAAQKIWLIIPLGIAAFLVFYFVFLFAIKKWDLKTPGREDDDLEAEKKVELASDNYTAIAAKILEGCGGKENITSIDNCVTRLRLEVKDITAVNDKVIKSAGVAGVIKPGKTSVQVIVGTEEKSSLQRFLTF